MAKNAGAANGTGHKLVIVESPAKAKTIAGYLGRGYVVESSIGHIRDLPQSAADVPAKIKGEPWARLGVDVDHDFTPYYVVSRDKKSHMTKLKGLLKDAAELYLATDEDREGEAIAWHLLDELKPKVPVHRMVFHEITPQAINAAVDNPREHRHGPRRGAGGPPHPRPALRLRGLPGAVEEGHVRPVRRPRAVRRDPPGRRPGAGADGVPHRVVLGPRGHLRRRREARRADVPGQAALRRRPAGRPRQRLHLARRAEAPVRKRRAPGPVPRRGAGRRRCSDTSFEIRSVEAKPYRRQPYAPFRTTTLQQEASRKLGFGASRTMSVAQRLYENGFITYMRTDSTTLSETAVAAARAQARELYGARVRPGQARAPTPRKVKNAQEAHEAIRPAGENFRTPAQTGLTGDEFRLYELIWMRTVASQMKDAEGRSVTVRLGGAAASGEDVVFSAVRPGDHLPRLPQGVRRGPRRPGHRVRRPGDPAAERRRGRRASPPRASTPSGHQTKPPARYTEATLIRELEEREIGRPSTYASIIGTILNRGYVYKKGTALVPAWLAFSVIRLLEEHFTRLVDYEFTAGMEDVLDEIAGGRRDRNAELAEFYFGSGDVEGLQAAGHRARRHRRPRAGDVPDRRRASTCGSAATAPTSRTRRRRRPRPTCPRTCRPTSSPLEKAKELLANPAGEETRARRGPRDRADDRGQERPLRALRHRAAARGRAEVARSRAPARCSSR